MLSNSKNDEWPDQIETISDNFLIVHPRQLGKGVAFERIRRITGYLVGSKERFNDAKKAEEEDRLKHF